jgi:protein SCO1
LAALVPIVASCTDVCPMLTDKMARVQDALRPDFGTEVADRDALAGVRP